MLNLVAIVPRRIILVQVSFNFGQKLRMAPFVFVWLALFLLRARPLLQSCKAYLCAETYTF